MWQFTNHVSAPSDFSVSNNVNWLLDLCKLFTGIILYSLCVLFFLVFSLVAFFYSLVVVAFIYEFFLSLIFRFLNSIQTTPKHILKAATENICPIRFLFLYIYMHIWIFAVVIVVGALLFSVNTHTRRLNFTLQLFISRYYCGTTEKK